MQIDLICWKLPKIPKMHNPERGPFLTFLYCTFSSLIVPFIIVSELYSIYLTSLLSKCKTLPFSLESSASRVRESLNSITGLKKLNPNPYVYLDFFSLGNIGTIQDDEICPSESSFAHFRRGALFLML